MTRSSADPGWRVRRAAPADAPALSLVAGATLLEAFHHIIPGADLVAHVARNSSPEQFARWIDDPAAAVFVAEAAGTGAPVGYAVVTEPDFPIATGAGDAELRRIYTLTAFHGTGLGRALLGEAIAAARSSAADRMLLGVHIDNVRARAFYERAGFA